MTFKQWLLEYADGPTAQALGVPEMEPQPTSTGFGSRDWLQQKALQLSSKYGVKDMYNGEGGYGGGQTFDFFTMVNQYAPTNNEQGVQLPIGVPMPKDASQFKINDPQVKEAVHKAALQNNHIKAMIDSGQIDPNQMRIDYHRFDGKNAVYLVTFSSNPRIPGLRTFGGMGGYRNRYNTSTRK